MKREPPRLDLMKIFMKNRLRLLIPLLCGLSLFAPQFALGRKTPPPKPFDLGVDSIMRGPRLVGYPPTRVYWSQGSHRVYFRWKHADERPLNETSRYAAIPDPT